MEHIGFDTETEPFPPQGEKINTHWPAPPLVCLTWADSTGGAGLVGGDNEEALLELFARPAVFIGHNIAFDLGVLKRAWPRLDAPLRRIVDEGRVLDTRVLYFLRCPDPVERRCTLAGLAKRFLNMDLEKGLVRTSFRVGVPLTDEQSLYAMQDARATLGVSQRLLLLCRGALRDSDTFQRDVAAALVPQETPEVRYSRAVAYQAWTLASRGVAVCPDAAGAALVELEGEMDTAMEALWGHGLLRLRPWPGAEPVPAMGLAHVGRSWTPLSLSPPRVVRVWKGRVETKKALVGLNQIELQKRVRDWAAEQDIELPRTRTGLVSTAREDLQEHREMLSPDLQDFLEYQRVQKLISAFVRPLTAQRVARVFPSYFIPGAATGRWACSRPNLQQVPRGPRLRRLYVPEPGRVFVSADYPTLELYTLAQCMDSLGIRGPLLSALQEHAMGRLDLHTGAAQQMFPGELITKERRFAAKELNFGLPGGMGARRLARSRAGREQGWTLEYAAELRERWFNAFPDVREYLNLFRVRAEEVRPPWLTRAAWKARLDLPEDASDYDILRKSNKGRHVRIGLPSGRVIPDRTFTAAANAFFQGTGADVITAAFNLAVEGGLDVALVVHDSIVVAAPQDSPEPVGVQLSAIMTEALRVVCPAVPVPPIPYEVMERWS